MAEFEIAQAGCRRLPCGHLFLNIFHNVVVFKGIKGHLLNEVAKVSSSLTERSPLLERISRAAVIIAHKYLELCCSWYPWAHYLV